MTNPTDATESFQIPIAAAELYEAAFVPAFFAQWAPMLCAAADVRPGSTVLDVACGTGIAARTAAERVGPSGSVTGLDVNEAMLTVARRTRTDIHWRQGDASALPFDAGSFDVVLCQMALMFFTDRRLAIAEMGRVARHGGTVGLLVPSRLDAQALFRPFVDLATDVVGAEAESLLSAYFVCGDPDELAALVDSAGLRVTDAQTKLGTYRAPSVEQAVATEVESTPLIERLSEAAYARLREGARAVWEPFTTGDGALEGPFECQLVTAEPR